MTDNYSNHEDSRTKEQLTVADYEEVLADHRRLVRELDVLLNGEHGAAKQASLCDIIGQLKRQKCVPTSKQPSNLPQLLREAECRVNEHVWGDRRAIVSIPADVSRDVDILLLTAADQIEAMAAVGIRQEREIERLQGELDAANQHVKILSEARERLAHETSADAKLRAIITAYDDYRGRGVNPAPREYQAVVDAINAARSAVEPKAGAGRMPAWARLLLECRDALPAISLSSARLRSIDLTLADRVEAMLEPWRVTGDRPARFPAPTSPNDLVRWICPKCTTVNGIADEVCLGGSCGTKRPENGDEFR